MAIRQEIPPVWRLQADLISARLLIWIGSVGRDGEISAEAHLYLALQYDLLSHHYVKRRRYAKARRFARLAADHYRAGGWDGPPYAAAMAMPIPERWVIVDAVSRRRVSSSDVA
jgi:hypothetical protein